MRLWGFELALPLAVSDPDQRSNLRSSWSEMISPNVLELRDRDSADWSRIDSSRAEFEAALTGPQPELAELKRTFLTFANAFQVRFSQIDRALLGQCTSLMPLLPELRALAKRG